MKRTPKHSELIRKIAFSFLLILLTVVSISSCKEDFPISEVPEISLVAFGPDTVVQFTDSIFFSLNYKDGNGDLGENDTDDDNLIVTDTRIGVRYTYRIKQLVPGGSKVPINGNLNFSISNTFITDLSSAEKLSYSIYVVDRAGNKSNVITTKSIWVVE